MNTICLLSFCGYMPSTHPMHQRGNYPQTSEAGSVLFVNIDEIEMLVQVHAEDVVKDCKITTCKSSANENEKIKAIEEFAATYSDDYVAVQLKTGRHIYARATIGDFQKAFEYRAKHPECQGLDLDQLPKE